MSVVKPQFLIGAAASGSGKTTFTMCRICFLARFEMQRQQWPEEKWMKFSYKRKKRNDNQQ